jgi:hypothetical protein
MQRHANANDRGQEEGYERHTKYERQKFVAVKLRESQKKSS